jgi:hypothetical protein
MHRSANNFAGQVRVRLALMAKNRCIICDTDTIDCGISNGEAAHIIAASPDGPRAGSMPLGWVEADLATERNGLWLCPHCHTKIDKDPARYTTEALLYEKMIKEQERNRIADPRARFYVPVERPPVAKKKRKRESAASEKKQPKKKKPRLADGCKRCGSAAHVWEKCKASVHSKNGKKLCQAMQRNLLRCRRAVGKGRSAYCDTHGH